MASNKTTTAERRTSNDAHDRGPGLPSSLESFHHIDHEGNVVHSPAQKAALDNAEKIRQRHASEARAKEPQPAWSLDRTFEPNVRIDVVAETIPPPKLVEGSDSVEVDVSQGEELDEES